MKLKNRRFLPPLKDLDEAVAMCDQEHDDFYLDAFLIQSWIDQVRLKTEQEYTRRSGPGGKVLQLGQAQCSFLRVFGHTRDTDLYALLHSLYRFAEYDQPMGNALSCALLPLSLEHQVSGDFERSRAPDPMLRPREAQALMRESLERWCDWLEAVVHLQAHARWHMAPRTFLEGKRPGGTAGGRWPFKEVDEGAICLWPLVKRHNWSYGDLLKVLGDVLRQPEVHPCRSEQALANYCTHSLGLRKTGRAPGSKGTRPPGYEIALRLCPPVRRSVGLGLPPWS